jgi:hypothetical protein
MKLEINKIKSRHVSDGFLNIFKKDYLAAWIANLGVVPLFLLAAFLFAPAFFFFLSLLFVVTHVLETICKLPSSYRSNISLYNDFKPSFLPIKRSCVKGIVITICSLSPMTILMAESKSLDLIVARGQSIEIPLNKMEKFNVGNRQVITYRLNEKTKNLLIRGAQLGHSEILVWNQDKSLQTFQIFVISKQQEAKLMHLSNEITSLHLESLMLVPHLKVTGVIKNLSQYYDYKKLLDQNVQVIMDEVDLSTELKNKIYSGVYTAFFDDYNDSIKCSSEFSHVTCVYPKNDSPNPSTTQYLTNKYKISFIQNNNQHLKTNYRLKIKLVQLEQLDGEDLRLGLEQVSGSLADFLSIGVEKIIQKNQVLLSQKKVRLSTLAEPLTIVRALTPAVMQIGADIPFKNVSANNTPTTDWKFAGLKIKVLLENYGDKVKINYETELTQPNSDAQGAGSISGNKEKSSVVVSLKTAVKIFQISLKTEGKSTDQMPFLNAIPLLGELFKSKSDQSNYKTITGILEVEENDE